MKLLIDAQLPKRLANDLTAAGHDTLHTIDLPLGNQTPDEELATQKCEIKKGECCSDSRGS